GLQLSRSAYDVGKKRCAARFQERKYLARGRTQTALHALLFLPANRRHPVGLFAQKEGHWSNTGGNHAPASIAAALECGRMRRKSSPGHRTGEAELIKLRRFVSRQPPRKYLALPRVCRNFEPLQLTYYFQQSPLARELSARRDVLPARQPAHKLRWRGRFNLPAQNTERKPVNAGQQAAVAPLGDAIAAHELAAQDRAL